MTALERNLGALLFECWIGDDDLYYLTGFHISDVTSAEALNEVIRLLSSIYCDLDRFRLEEGEEI